MTQTIYFYVQETSLGVGVNGLTVTWDIDRITRSSGARTALVTAGATSITFGRRGLYGYSLTGADPTLYDYIATAITTDLTVDSKELVVTQSQITNLPAGALSSVVHVDDGTNPLDGVDVWVTTDALGSNVVARGQTDTSGNVTFMLDTGTYYFWKQLAGYTFTNPQIGTV